MELKQRSIVVAILLSLVTCGIYGIYWMFEINKETNELAGNVEYTSGWMVLLLSLVTCGIYTFFWNYKIGQNVNEINGDSNMHILFLILSLCGLGIVNYFLAQDAINKRIA